MIINSENITEKSNAILHSNMADILSKISSEMIKQIHEEDIDISKVMS